MLAESIDRAMLRHQFRLTAFVFMPEHVHLLVYPLAEASRISAVLNAIKRPFSYRVKRFLTETNPRLLERLTIRQRPGVTSFRYWQEGSGYDRNLTNTKTILAAIDYIHENPVRRGLVQNPSEWKWSSAYFYADTPPPTGELPAVHALPPEWLLESQ